MYFQLETVREFFGKGLKFLFLINGVITADLRGSGTNAKFVEECVNVVLNLFKRRIGIGSGEQFFFGNFCTILATSSSVASLKCSTWYFLISSVCEFDVVVNLLNFL